MNKRPLSQALLVACILCASPAAKGAPPPADDHQPPIVIEGQLKSILQHFVAAMTQAGPTDQLGRWKQEICPTVVGIDPRQAVFMEDRIAEVAKLVRLRKGGAGCTTSLTVIITPSPAAIAYSLAREYPRTLSTDGNARLWRFVETTEPVRWITVTDECGGGCELANSRLQKETAPTFVDMIIIVDAARLSSYSLGELSDYVALIGLTNPPVEGSRPSNSIMSMFDVSRTASAPFELTSYDFSFLSGLYRTSIRNSASTERGSILTTMTRGARRAH